MKYFAWVVTVIAFCSFSPGLLACDLPPVVESLNELVESRAEAGWFSGVVSASYKGEVVYQAAYGDADLQRKLPMRLDTPINLGSTPKLFAAISIAQLQRAGKLDYHDPVVEHLPELSDQVGNNVTLAHLLSHTSGLAEFLNPAFRDRLSKARSNHDLYELAATLDPREGPGKSMRYTNSNFIILGEVIERSSGVSFESYLTKHIFEPAGMVETRLIRAGDRKAGNIAINYTVVPGHEAMRMMSDRERTKEFIAESKAAEPTTAFSHEAPLFGGGMIANAAGGAYSTAADMSRFAKALREEKLLPWQDLMRLCEPRNAAGSRTPPTAHYGWGCATSGSGQAQAIGHGGGSIGMQTWFLIHTRIPLDLVVMSNHHRQADPIRDAVRAELEGMSAPPQ